MLHALGMSLFGFFVALLAPKLLTAQFSTTLSMHCTDLDDVAIYDQVRDRIYTRWTFIFAGGSALLFGLAALAIDEAVSIAIIVATCTLIVASAGLRAFALVKRGMAEMGYERPDSTHIGG